VIRRRGFTLLEMSISLAIIGLLAGSVGSVITLMARTIPDGDDPAIVRAAIGRVLWTLHADVRTAHTVTLVGSSELIASVADRTGDGVDDVVTYRWSGQVGDPMTRRLNSGPDAVLLTAAQLVAFGWAENGASNRLISTITQSGVELTAEQRCLNVEAGS
jgi:prepilin-type N-terminal cleavage/methylation domain-containing protein